MARKKIFITVGRKKRFVCFAPSTKEKQASQPKNQNKEQRQAEIERALSTAKKVEEL